MNQSKSLNVVNKSCIAYFLLLMLALSINFQLSHCKGYIKSKQIFKNLLFSSVSTSSANFSSKTQSSASSSHTRMPLLSYDIVNTGFDPATTQRYEDYLNNVLREEFNISSSNFHDKIHNLYLPTYKYLRALIDNTTIINNNEKRTVLFGLSAPQGCGKTTLTSILVKLFEFDDLSAVSMSLDDFYLTGEEQDNVALQHSNNPLLAYRGNAGTHDINLATKVLKQFLSVKHECNVSMMDSDYQDDILIPRYDKSLRAGRGDRVASQAWTRVSLHDEITRSFKPVDIVMFEGWMLGFTPIDEQYDVNSLQTGSLPEMKDIDEKLKNYRELHELFDGWLVLAVDDIDVVYKWRLEAEQRMRSSGKPSLSDQQVT